MKYADQVILDSKVDTNRTHKNKLKVLSESQDLKNKYLGKEFQSSFLPENVMLNIEINDNLDLIVEIANKMEMELFK